MRKESVTKKNIAPAIVCTAPWRLTQVKPLPNYTLQVKFTDGVYGIVEMQTLIMSENAGVFAKLKDLKVFYQVYLNFGVATWPGEIDLAPDAMYDEIKQHGKLIL